MLLRRLLFYPRNHEDIPLFYQNSEHAEAYNKRTYVENIILEPESVFLSLQSVGRPHYKNCVFDN